MSERKRLLRADDVASIVGVNRRKAAELMMQMPRVNIGANENNPRWAVFESDLTAWLYKRTVQPAEPAVSRRGKSKPDPVKLGLLDENGLIPRRK